MSGLHDVSSGSQHEGVDPQKESHNESKKLRNTNFLTCASLNSLILYSSGLGVKCAHLKKQFFKKKEKINI